MTLFGLMPTFNETGRYLESALKNVMPIVDRMFVWDDRSTDNSVEVARSLGAHVEIRPAEAQSFIEHEGNFRQLGWDTFESSLQPSHGDWIIAIDADEVLVTTGQNYSVRCEIDRAIQAAEAVGHLSVLIPVPEIFGLDTDGTPLVRTDGLWPTVAGTVLFKYIPNARYRDKPMGCGREPVAVTQNFSRQAFGLHLLHYGYSRRADQISKHARYTSLLAHGHNDSHIASIVTTPTLKRWEGPVPEMLRGDEYSSAA